MARNCKTCKHARFDERWGEYKCIKLYIRVYNPERKDCVHYRRKSKKEVPT
jgi:hypothetical protein